MTRVRAVMADRSTSELVMGGVMSMRWGKLNEVDERL